MSNNSTSPPPQQTVDASANHFSQPAQSPTDQQCGDNEAIARLTAERDRLQAELNAARAELAKTVAELQEVSEERDTYRHELIFILRRDDITFTEEEIEEALQNARPADEWLREFGIDADEKD